MVVGMVAGLPHDRLPQIGRQLDQLLAGVVLPGSQLLLGQRLLEIAPKKGPERGHRPASGRGSLDQRHGRRRRMAVAMAGLDSRVSYVGHGQAPDPALPGRTLGRPPAAPLEHSSPAMAGQAKRCRLATAWPSRVIARARLLQEQERGVGWERRLLLALARCRYPRVGQHDQIPLSRSAAQPRQILRPFARRLQGP
jgi:hypothetical protein